MKQMHHRGFAAQGQAGKPPGNTAGGTMAKTQATAGNIRVQGRDRMT
jgi:hypothetical protein